MIAPYSTIYQILHSRPDNGYNHKQSRFIIQFEATFDRNINVDFKDKCLQIVNTCFKFKLWVFSLLTLSHQQQAAHSSQRAKHQQSNQSTISLNFWMVGCQQCIGSTLPSSRSDLTKAESHSITPPGVP